MSTTTNRLRALWQDATPSNIVASIAEAERLLSVAGVEPDQEALRYMEGLLRVAELAGHEVEVEGEEEDDEGEG